MLNIIDFTLNMSSSGATDGAFTQLSFSTENTNHCYNMYRHLLYSHVKWSQTVKREKSQERVVDVKTTIF